MATPRRRGRRPGQPDTRQAILDAARRAFADGGYDGTSVRQIAATAGVDAALVHHYYGTKEQLFLASVRFPIEPGVLAQEITDGPVEHLGSRIAETFLAAWEHPASGPALEAMLRGALTNRLSGRLVREFFTVQISRRVTSQLAGIVGADDLPARATLVASQLFGLAVVRHVLRLEPLASTPRPAVVAVVAPTLQRYLTGDLGGTASADGRAAATPDVVEDEPTEPRQP